MESHKWGEIKEVADSVEEVMEVDSVEDLVEVEEIITEEEEEEEMVVFQ